MKKNIKGIILLLFCCSTTHAALYKRECSLCSHSPLYISDEYRKQSIKSNIQKPEQPSLLASNDSSGKQLLKRDHSNMERMYSVCSTAESTMNDLKPSSNETCHKHRDAQKKFLAKMIESKRIKKIHQLSEQDPAMKRAILILVTGVIFFALSLLMTIFYYPIISFILLSSILLLYGIIYFFMTLVNKNS
ncbi:MAG: hypothetical protein NZ529_00860 [Cytophagaceae bacterium]|nr:hypothetical protein [Cytophagaceae bacterium]MDW8455315.1 hypothetical protein [Cytophagaceae bacterium]